MVRREVRGDVEDRAVRGPSRRSIGHRVRRTPRSCRLIPWTRAFGPSPIRVQEARAGSRTARSTLIWEIPARIPPVDGEVPLDAHSRHLPILRRDRPHPGRALGGAMPVPEMRHPRRRAAGGGADFPASEGFLPLDLDLGEGLPLSPQRPPAPGGGEGSCRPPSSCPPPAWPSLCSASWPSSWASDSPGGPSRRPTSARPAPRDRPLPSPSVESPGPPRKVQTGEPNEGRARVASPRDCRLARGAAGHRGPVDELREMLGNAAGGEDEPNSSVGSRGSRDSLGSWIGRRPILCGRGPRGRPPGIRSGRSWPGT